jgi:hypothetical protein
MQNQDLKEGHYYLFSSEPVDEYIKEHMVDEYFIGKLVEATDEDYKFEDLKRYNVNSSDEQEQDEEESGLPYSKEDFSEYVVEDLGEDKDAAANKPFLIKAAWDASNSSTSTSTVSRPSTDISLERIRQLEEQIRQIQIQLNQIESLRRVPESERPALAQSMASNTGNPEEDDEPSENPRRGGRSKSVKRNRNRSRRVTYRLRRRT